MTAGNKEISAPTQGCFHPSSTRQMTELRCHKGCFCCKTKKQKQKALLEIGFNELRADKEVRMGIFEDKNRTLTKITLAC